MLDMLDIQLCSYCENCCPTIDFPCIDYTPEELQKNGLCIARIVKNFYNNWQEEENLILKK